MAGVWKAGPVRRPMAALFNVVTHIHPGHLAGLVLRSNGNASEPGRLAMGIRTAGAAGAALLLSGLAAQALESSARIQRQGCFETFGRCAVGEDRRLLWNSQVAPRPRKM